MENLQKGFYKDAHTPPYRPLYERSLTPELVILQVASHNEVLKHAGIITFLLKKNGDGWLAEEVNVQAVEGLRSSGDPSQAWRPVNACRRSASSKPVGH